MLISRSTLFRYEILEQSDTARQLKIDNRLPATLRPNAARLWVELIAPIVHEFELIIMTGGYRCQTLNEAVKGSPRSQHMQAQAIDYRISSTDRAVMQRHYQTVASMPLPYHQFIIYDSFFHISISPDPSAMPRRQLIDNRAKKT